jgi:hypothetical protein
VPRSPPSPCSTFRSFASFSDCHYAIVAGLRESAVHPRSLETCNGRSWLAYNLAPRRLLVVVELAKRFEFQHASNTFADFCGLHNILRSWTPSGPPSFDFSTYFLCRRCFKLGAGERPTVGPLSSPTSEALPRPSRNSSKASSALLTLHFICFIIIQATLRLRGINDSTNGEISCKPAPRLRPPALSLLTWQMFF